MPFRNFIPDSGKLLHLRTPTTTADLRIDAGFIEGDEISSHYDPMIAKLIVRGASRTAALRKLQVALESYEIAGPTTNIEFLKRICVSQDFADGTLETGYIEKHRDELFAPLRISSEVWAQVALGTLLAEVAAQKESNKLLPAGSAMGFGSGYQSRTFHFGPVTPDANDPDPTIVKVHQISKDTYNVTVGETTYSSVQASLTTPRTLTAYYPHTRLNSTLISSADSNRLSLFHLGTMYRLKPIVPAWIEKALGIKDVANSVVAPMPCKILRVDVAEGDVVRKDQSLVVIESMKMETVIRAPMDGTVKRVVHGKGEMCKAGTALVEFEVGEAEGK